MTNRATIWIWGAALAAGCAAPTLDDTRWRCAAQADCTDGNICNTKVGVCETADSSGLHGVFDDRLVLGMSAALTSGPTGLGLGMKAGIEAWFAEVNRRGGV